MVHNKADPCSTRPESPSLERLQTKGLAVLGMDAIQSLPEPAGLPERGHRRSSRGLSKRLASGRRRGGRRLGPRPSLSQGGTRGARASKPARPPDHGLALTPRLALPQIRGTATVRQPPRSMGIGEGNVQRFPASVRAYSFGWPLPSNTRGWRCRYHGNDQRPLRHARSGPLGACCRQRTQVLSAV